MMYLHFEICLGTRGTENLHITFFTQKLTKLSLIYESS